MSDLFNIGVSGLKTAQQQLATTGHNISNVNTPGYARQRTEQSSLKPSYSGAGYTGNGVQADNTVRYYDEFLEDQIRSSNSQLSKFETYNDLAAQVDNILANPDAGLTPTLEDFFSALQEANDYPSSAAARSVLLSSANTLTERFQSIQNNLNDLNSQANNRLVDISNEISSRSKSIAQLNEQIASYSSSGTTPNDLLDKREQLIKEVSERVEVDVVYQDNGAANVFIGSGQPLVLGNNAFSMSVENSQYSPQDKRILLNGANGSIDMTAQIRGGELQGVMDFKSDILDASLNALGSIAASVSAEVNAQHQLGMTLRETSPGVFNLGGNFFSDISTGNALNSSNNLGNASYTYNITDTSVLTSNDYEMSYSSNAGLDTFSLTRLSDGMVFSGSGADTTTALGALNNDLANLPPNAVNTPQGISINLAGGVVQAGDSFLFQPTRELAGNISVQVSDELDIALASPLSSSKAVDNLGVGINNGTGEIQLQPLNGNVNNIPIDDGIGNPVDLVLSYNGTGFDISTTTNPALAPYPAAAANPPINPGPIVYSSADSGQTYSLPGADYNQISFTLSGAPAIGDRFVISNNNSPVDDNRNGLEMANLQTKDSMLDSSADFQSAYGLMVAGVGTLTHSSEIDMAAQTTLSEQAQETRGSLSGVNLDEEAAQLLKFQQAYTAAAKVISTADDVFKTLLDAVG